MNYKKFVASILYYIREYELNIKNLLNLKFFLI